MESNHLRTARSWVIFPNTCTSRRWPWCASRSKTPENFRPGGPPSRFFEAFVFWTNEKIPAFWKTFPIFLKKIEGWIFFTTLVLLFFKGCYTTNVFYFYPIMWNFGHPIQLMCLFCCSQHRQVLSGIVSPEAYFAKQVALGTELDNVHVKVQSAGRGFIECIRMKKYQ